MNAGAPSPAARLRFRGRIIKSVLMLLLFLSGGAIVNVAVAWALFPGEPEYRVLLESTENADQSGLVASGVQAFDYVETDTYRTTGFVDRSYSTLLDAAGDIYPMLYARETCCGWPMLAFRGVRWSSIVLNEQKQRHEFVQKHIHVTAIPIDDRARMIGEREYLPIGPLWPSFAINTVLYAVVLFALCFGFVQGRCIIRLRRGRCPKCAYPMGRSPMCTECGAALPGKRRKDEATLPESRRMDETTAQR